MRISTLCIGFPALKICAHIVQRAFTVKHPPLELFQLPVLFGNRLVDNASRRQSVAARRVAEVQRPRRADDTDVVGAPRGRAAKPPVTGSCLRRLIVLDAVGLRGSVVQGQNAAFRHDVIAAEADLRHAGQKQLVAGGIAAAQRVAHFIDSAARGRDVHRAQRVHKIRVKARQKARLVRVVGTRSKIVCRCHQLFAAALLFSHWRAALSAQLLLP